MAHDLEVERQGSIPAGMWFWTKDGRGQIWSFVGWCVCDASVCMPVYVHVV